MNLGRQIDSGKHGFLPGISWAILTAICAKRYKLLSVDNLLRAFFDMYSDSTIWNTQLCFSTELPTQTTNLNEAGINIFTQISPTQNSSLLVNMLTKRVIENEMQRARLLMDTDWQQVFEPSDPLKLYKKFVVISIRSNDPSKQDLLGRKIKLLLKYSRKIRTSCWHNFFHIRTSSGKILNIH
jgi:hypothetical protein